MGPEGVRHPPTISFLVLMHEVPSDEVDLSAIGVEGQAIFSPAYQALRVAGYVGDCDRAVQGTRR